MSSRKLSTECSSDRSHVLDLLDHVIPVHLVHPLAARDAAKQAGLMFRPGEDVVVAKGVRHDNLSVSSGTCVLKSLLQRRPFVGQELIQREGARVRQVCRPLAASHGCHLFQCRKI
jgi:hypothetical protein